MMCVCQVNTYEFNIVDTSAYADAKELDLRRSETGVESFIPHIILSLGNTRLDSFFSYPTACSLHHIPVR